MNRIVRLVLGIAIAPVVGRAAAYFWPTAGPGLLCTAAAAIFVGVYLGGSGYAIVIGCATLAGFVVGAMK